MKLRLLTTIISSNCNKKYNFNINKKAEKKRRKQQQWSASWINATNTYVSSTASSNQYFKTEPHTHNSKYRKPYKLVTIYPRDTHWKSVVINFIVLYRYGKTNHWICL